MKKALVFAAFMALGSTFVFAQGPVTVNPQQVLAELDYFSRQYPRTEGSEGERRSVAYIKQRLDALGVGYSQQNFNDLEGAHSFSSSIEVSIKGARPDELLIVAPLDQPPDATRNEDGAINLALALGLIESVHRSDLPISLRFLFLGGEFGTGAGYPIGTREFLTNFYPDYPVAVLYLNFRFVPVRTNITGGGRRIIAPYWLINRCSAAMDQSGLFYLLRGNENQIFRLGLIQSAPPINPYLQAGYPALELSSLPGRLPPGEHGRWIASFMRYIDSFIASSRSGFPTDWDHHYLFFQARFFSFILTEREYVILVVAILGLLLAYPIVLRERFTRYLRTIWKNLHSIPLLLALVFGFLMLGTLLVEAVSMIRSFPSIWMHAPLLFFLCKAAAALFLFAVLYRFLKQLPFSRNGRFYSAASILLLLIDSIVLGLFDFSLAYYFIWALVFSVLFSTARWKWLKALFLAASTAWLVKAAVDIFTLPALDVVRAILLSRVKGNIILALIILPFLFMIIRLDLLFRHPRRGRGVAVVRAIDTVLGVATVGLFVYLSIFSVYGPSNPRPLSVTEIMNLDTNRRTIRLESPAPIGRVTIKTHDLTQTISTRSRIYTTIASGTQQVLDEQTTSSAFLDRQRIDLRLEPLGNPYLVSVTLTSAEQIVIFDANFPFSYSPSGEEATIHIGSNPPFPLDVQFTLPKQSTVNVRLDLTYSALPYPIEVSGSDISVQKSLVVHKSFPLGKSAQ